MKERRGNRNGIDIDSEDFILAGAIWEEKTYSCPLCLVSTVKIAYILLPANGIHAIAALYSLIFVVVV